MFVEYGDDSVAQLGGVHLACEQASQLLCKALEWGRLAAYLEQSTRYMRYDDKPGGRWRATVPPELAGTELEPTLRAFLDEVFGATARCTGRWRRGTASGSRRMRATRTSSIARRSWRRRATRCACCCPPATRSNLGIYATGQSYEQLLMRLAVHPLAEMREYGALMLEELRKVIPAFLKRVDVEDRGVAWARYWRGRAEGVEEWRRSAARRRRRPSRGTRSRSWTSTPRAS